jgi:polar amino acid transport system substrate-binding protein
MNLKTLPVGLALSLALTALPLAAIAQAAAPAAKADKAAATDRSAYQKRVDVPRNTFRHIRSTGKMRVCVATYAPWVMRGPEDKLVGFSIDVATQLADDLDVELEFVPTAFATIVPALVHGDCELIVSGLSATPENALFVNFSNVLETHPVQVLARKSGDVMRSKADIDRDGVTLGVLGDSSVAGLARRSFTKAKVLAFENDRALADALAAGKVQAVVAGSPTPELISRASPDAFYLPLDKGLGLRAEAIAVRRSDDELLNYLNTWIQARRFDGFLGARADYWFRSMDWAKK